MPFRGARKTLPPHGWRGGGGHCRRCERCGGGGGRGEDAAAAVPPAHRPSAPSPPVRPRGSPDECTSTGTLHPVQELFAGAMRAGGQLHAASWRPPNGTSNVPLPPPTAMASLVARRHGGRRPSSSAGTPPTAMATPLPPPPPPWRSYRVAGTVVVATRRLRDAYPRDAPRPPPG